MITTDHLFYVHEQSWLKASLLASGMHLLDNSGKATLSIVSQTKLEDRDTVFNFEVKDFRTYHIGKLNVWVHNANCCDIANLNTRWNKGTYEDSSASLIRHFKKHKEEVGATDMENYLRKAEAFKQNLRGATKSSVEGGTSGVIRYKKNGKYIDLVPDGSIISFGKQ